MNEPVLKLELTKEEARLLQLFIRASIDNMEYISFEMSDMLAYVYDNVKRFGNE